MQSIYFPCIPYLGETFSCFVTCGSKRIQYIAEQCTIHPNTSAFYVEDDAKEFQIEGTLQPKYLFCGNSIRCMIHGSITIHHKCGDCVLFVAEFDGIVFTYFPFYLYFISAPWIA